MTSEASLHWQARAAPSPTQLLPLLCACPASAAPFCCCTLSAQRLWPPPPPPPPLRLAPLLPLPASVTPAQRRLPSSSAPVAWQPTVSRPARAPAGAPTRSPALLSARSSSAALSSRSSRLLQTGPCASCPTLRCLAPAPCPPAPRPCRRRASGGMSSASSVGAALQWPTVARAARGATGLLTRRPARAPLQRASIVGLAPWSS